MGIKSGRIHCMNDLVKDDDVLFPATSVTDGELLRGVRFRGTYSEMHSLVLSSKSSTICLVEGRHSTKKKPHLVMQD